MKTFLIVVGVIVVVVLLLHFLVKFFVAKKGTDQIEAIINHAFRVAGATTATEKDAIAMEILNNMSVGFETKNDYYNFIAVVRMLQPETLSHAGKEKVLDRFEPS